MSASSPPPRPRVSVVMAAYGRPEVMRWAIESVRRQSLQDWELLVVGDACDDATASVAQSQAAQDARIRFINLHTNHGEQSGPNNVGVARSQGRYIAFLNQDDLWFADHLAQLVDWLEATGSDLAYGLSAHLPAVQRRESDRLDASIAGLGRAGHFDPLSTFSPASAWLMRRACAEQMGAWRPALECRAEASQDFLFRAWRQGLRLTNCPVPTVLVFSSGSRHGSYATNADEEQAFFSERLQQDPLSLRNQLVVTGGFMTDPFIGRANMHSVLRRILMGLAWCGLHPRAWHLRQRGSRRSGSYIRHLRHVRGLPRLMASQASAAELKQVALQALCDAPPLAGKIDFRAGGTAWRHLGQGWSVPEPTGCWTDSTEAELLLCMPPPSSTETACITLTLQPFVSDKAPRQRFLVLVNRRPVFVGLLKGSEVRDVRLTLDATLWDGDHLLRIRLLLPDAISPQEVMEGASDQRRLGILLSSMAVSQAAQPVAPSEIRMPAAEGR